MLYDVEQIAKLTQVSKVTVYRKLKLNEIQPYIIVKQGKSYLDEEGFHVISELLNVITPENGELTPKEIEQAESIENKGLLHETSCNYAVVSELKSQIEFLQDLLKNHPSKDEIEFLKSQLQEKDKQLESKDKLLENMQVLVKNSQLNQERDIPMLEAHFMELDEKLANIRAEMEQRKIKYQEEQQQKGFWEKLFRK